MNFGTFGNFDAKYFLVNLGSIEQFFAMPITRSISEDAIKFAALWTAHPRPSCLGSFLLLLNITSYNSIIVLSLG